MDHDDALLQYWSVESYLDSTMNALFLVTLRRIGTKVNNYEESTHVDPVTMTTLQLSLSFSFLDRLLHTFPTCTVMHNFVVLNNI
jgi:hypothetical protein